MANLVKAASRADVTHGQGKCVEVSGKPLALFNVGGDFFAIDSTCPHRGGPLGEGTLEVSIVTCPWHGWQFDCKTGQSPTAPGKAVSTYAVQVQGEDIMVDVG